MSPPPQAPHSFASSYIGFSQVTLHPCQQGWPHHGWPVDRGEGELPLAPWNRCPRGCGLWLSRATSRRRLEVQLKTSAVPEETAAGR